MNLNKKLAKTMVFALALGMLPFSGVTQVKAAKPTNTNITLDLVEENLKVADADKDNALFWTVATKVEDASKAQLTINGESYKLGEIETVVGQIIDLSSFSKKKDLVIAIGDTETPDDAKWIVKKVNAQNKYFKIEYMPSTGDKGKKINTIAMDNHGLGNAEAGFLVYSSNKEGTAEELKTAGEKIEVQEGDGAWKTFKAYFTEATSEQVGVKLAGLISTGKTLQFRLKGTDGWNSNVVKLKINSQANAPKITLNPSKGTTNIKKGLEYKLVVTGKQAKDIEWTKIEGNEKIDFKKLEIYNGAESAGVKGGKLYARSSATDKKLASKTSEITLTKMDAPTPVNVTAQGVKIVEADKISLNLKVKYDLTKGAELINEGDKDYEYYVSANGEEAESPKWKTLKKQKVNSKGVAKPTKTTIKYSEDGKAGTYTSANSKIFYRIAGEKQEGDEVKLASPTVSSTITFANITQTMSAAAATTGITVSNAKTSSFDVKKATAKEHKIAFTLTGRQKQTSPKVKVIEKLKGVSVKMSKYDKNNKSTATIKVSKTAFKEASESNILKFEIVTEGNKTEHTVTIKAID